MKSESRRRRGELSQNVVPALRARIILAAVFVLLGVLVFHPIGHAVAKCVGGLTSILPTSP